MKKKYILIISTLIFSINVIAQPTRTWGTFYGGTGDDYARSVAVDASGNVYVAGYTSGSNSISTVGSHQSTFGGGVYDAYLVKFNSAGVRQWATYYGGFGDDYAYSVAVDGSGNVYLAGFTESTNAISTVGSHQSSFGGGSVDAFIVKFNSSGLRQWATYYGSTGYDRGHAVAVDGIGNVYLGGVSGSNSSISTIGSHQQIIGGSADAFIVKFNSSGVQQWATYYGGTLDEYGYSIAVDASSNVYLGGYTYSSNNIGTAGSHQVGFAGGAIDGFIVKFNSGGVRQWGTYYGGTGNDFGNSLAVDPSGNIYLGGKTDSPAGISTIGSHQAASGGNFDGYLVKLNSSGIRQWGTYYGDTGDEDGYSIATDASGNIYFSGSTTSNMSISTMGSHQPTIGGGLYDGYLTKFNSIGVRQWATYYGGTVNDYGYSVGVDAINTNIYLTGYTSSSNAISSVGSHQPMYAGGLYDSFLTQFVGCAGAPNQPGTINGLTSICIGAGSTNYSIASVAGATSYTWSLPGGWFGTSATNTISATPGSSGVFSITATNACGTSSASVLGVTVNALPTILASTNNTLLCTGQSATLTASGASTFTFNPGGAGASIVVSPTITANYTITGTTAQGCNNLAVFTQSVSACTDIASTPSPLERDGVRLYPNPFNNIFTITSNKKETTQVVIYNAIGQEVASTLFYFGEGLGMRLDLTEQPNGIYIIRIGSVTKKIIKQ